MSMFSGKCDLADWLEIHSTDKDDESNRKKLSFEKIENLIKKANFYIRSSNEDNKVHKIQINNLKEITPYYPYIICLSAHTKDVDNIVLTNESYVDSEEREMLIWRLDQIKKVYRRCKRKKINFTLDETYKDAGGYFGNTKVIEELFKRVSENGDKATIDGLYLPFWDLMRQYLYDEMIAVGYDEVESIKWCFPNVPFEEAKKRLEKVRNPK